jgi:hypothetical protein
MTDEVRVALIVDTLQARVERQVASVKGMSYLAAAEADHAHTAGMGGGHGIRGR